MEETKGRTFLLLVVASDSLDNTCMNEQSKRGISNSYFETTLLDEKNQLLTRLPLSYHASSAPNCSLVVYNSRHSERLTDCCFLLGLLSWKDLS